LILYQGTEIVLSNGPDIPRPYVGMTYDFFVQTGSTVQFSINAKRDNGTVDLRAMFHRNIRNNALFLDSWYGQWTDPVSFRPCPVYSNSTFRIKLSIEEDYFIINVNNVNYQMPWSTADIAPSQITIQNHYEYGSPMYLSRVLVSQNGNRLGT
jgi:hypothetical protein